VIVLLQLGDHPLLQPQGELDSGYYARLAKQVADGDWLAGQRVFFVSPLYIYFLAATFLATDGSTIGAQLVQVLLGTAAVGLVWATAHRWFGSTVGWAAGALAAGTGYFTFHEILILQASLDPFLVALALFLLTHAALDGRPRSWMATGVAFGLLALNRPNALPVAAILAAAAGLHRWRYVTRDAAAAAIPSPSVGADIHGTGPAGSRRRAAGAALVPTGAMLAGLACVLLPVAARNMAVAGELALLSSHGGLNFYVGNRAGADGTYRRVEGIVPSITGQERDARRQAEAVEGRPLSDAAVSAHFYREAWRWIVGHPGDASRLFLAKLYYTFNAADVALNYSYAYYSRDEPSLLRGLIVGPWLLLPLGLFGGLVAGPALLRSPCDGKDGERRTAAWWLWASFVPLYALGVAAFFVAGRYRLPLLVPLSVTSAAGLVWLLRRAQDSARIEPPWKAIVPLVLLALACNWPAGLDNGRAGERVEMVLHLVDTRRDAEALSLLESTVAMHPVPADALVRTGTAFLERGASGRALPLLMRAHALAPERADVRLALGQALLDAGRPGEAVPHLRAVLDAGVRVDLAAFDLARALMASGNRADAGGALRRLSHVTTLDAASATAVARLALDLGEHALARTAAARAVALAPSDAVPRELFGLALEANGQRADAMRALEQAAQLDRANASARLNLAVLLAEEGRFAEARRAAEEALARRPDYGRARAFLQALPR
jgi:Flp pilus assembly protein TadD